MCPRIDTNVWALCVWALCVCAAYQEVEDLLRTSLPAMQAVHGPHALCVAGILSLLALTHARVGMTKINDTEADPVALALRALRIRQGLFGPSAALHQQEMLTALLLTKLGDHMRAEPLFRKAYVRATCSRKTPHGLRWLLYKHMERSGNLGFERSDMPNQPKWTPDYEDLIDEEPQQVSTQLLLITKHPGSQPADIVDIVMDDIKETAGAREREEAHERDEAAQTSARSKLSMICEGTPRSSSSRGKSGEKSSGTHGRGQDATGIKTFTGTQEVEERDHLTIHTSEEQPLNESDELGYTRRSLSRPTSARSSHRSLTRRSSASSMVGSSIGTEQAREELDMLGTTVVDMMDSVFFDVVNDLPAESETGSRTPTIIDLEGVPRKLLRPLSATGNRRKPARLEGLPEGVRPQTAGPARPKSALQAIIRSTTEHDEFDDIGSAGLPRLSMTAVGRARERRRMDSIDAHDEAGNTALHAAVQDNDADAVKSLLEAGASASASNKSGNAPIHLAARAGNLRIVKLLASAVSNVNQQGQDGRTPLHFAVESGSLILVQTLCETFGTDISSQSNNGETPVHLAARVLGDNSSVSRYLTTTLDSLPAI